MEPETNDPLLALQKIKASEEEARAIVREAREKISTQIVQTALEEAQKIRAAWLEEARKKGQGRRAELIRKARSEAEKITQETEEERRALRLKTEAAGEEAVAKVAEKIHKFLEKGVL